MTKVGIIGASGFTGAELLRLCAAHPELDVRCRHRRHAGRRTAVAELYPSLAGAYPDLVFAALRPGARRRRRPRVPRPAPRRLAGPGAADPRQASPHVVDLAADFRLHDPALYPTWYGEEHQRPELLAEFVYGLPELFRDEIAGARLVAAPGCYPTAAVARPGARSCGAGLVDRPGLIVDAASGVSGAGRPAKPNTTFCTVDEDFTAYGLLDPPPHARDRAETCRRPRCCFTPHLAPMNRGILATCYARPTGTTSTAELLDALREAYADEPFVVVTRPARRRPRRRLGSNTAHVTARLDERTGWIVADRRHRQPGQGCVGPGRAVRQHPRSASPETAGLPTIRGLTP